MKKDYTKLFLGLIIVAIGMSLFFNQFSFTIFGFSFTYLLSILWPLVFIVIGFSILFNGKSQAGIIIIVAGVLFLLNTVFDVNIWTLMWPLLIIAIGLAILLKGSSKSTPHSSTENYLSTNTILTGTEKKVTSNDFKGGNIFTVFGATDLDLRKAKISKEGAVMEITTIFGGVTILVPQDVVVQSEGSALLGSWEEKIDSEPSPDAPVLRIKGSVIFGGVEIK